MFWSVSRALAHSTSATPSSPGCASDHSSACIPPSEPPIAASGRSIPRWASSRRWTSTRSPTEGSGKRSPYARPVLGSVELGPVVPLQPPSRLELTTW